MTVTVAVHTGPTCTARAVSSSDSGSNRPRSPRPFLAPARPGLSGLGWLGRVGSGRGGGRRVLRAGAHGRRPVERGAGPRPARGDGGGRRRATRLGYCRRPGAGLAPRRLTCRWRLGGIRGIVTRSILEGQRTGVLFVAVQRHVLGHRDAPIAIANAIADRWSRASSVGPWGVRAAVMVAAMAERLRPIGHIVRGRAGAGAVGPLDLVIVTAGGRVEGRLDHAAQSGTVRRGRHRQRGEDRY